MLTKIVKGITTLETSLKADTHEEINEMRKDQCDMYIE